MGEKGKILLKLVAGLGQEIPFGIMDLQLFCNQRRPVTLTNRNATCRRKTTNERLPFPQGIYTC